MMMLSLQVKIQHPGSNAATILVESLLGSSV
jgi:hypothetical protein